MDDATFQRLKELSESQLKTIESLVYAMEKLEERVRAAEVLAQGLRHELTFLQGVVTGFQARFEALEERR